MCPSRGGVDQRNELCVCGDQRRCKDDYDFCAAQCTPGRRSLHCRLFHTTLQTHGDHASLYYVVNIQNCAAPCVDCGLWMCAFWLRVWDQQALCFPALGRSKNDVRRLRCAQMISLTRRLNHEEFSLGIVFWVFVRIAHVLLPISHKKTEWLLFGLFLIKEYRTNHKIYSIILFLS